MGIGTIEIHPIDLLGAYGAIANGGVLMPRTMILKVTAADGTRRSGRIRRRSRRRRRVISPQAAYIITDILAGNTESSTNPFWAEWAIYDGASRRPAAYKTGTTNDNRDVHAYGFLAPPKDAKAPALAVGVWMGNSNNEPEQGHPLARIVRAALVADPDRGQQGHRRSRTSGSRRAWSARPSMRSAAMKPGPFTTKTVKELFIAGTQPTQADDLRRTIDIDAASGLLWQEGCVGPMKTVGALDFSQVEADCPAWQKADNRWARPGRPAGAGVGRRAEGHPDLVLLRQRLLPVRPVVGRDLRPDEGSARWRRRRPSPPVCDNPFGLFCPPPSGRAAANPTREARQTPGPP